MAVERTVRSFESLNLRNLDEGANLAQYYLIN